MRNRQPFYRNEVEVDTAGLILMTLSNGIQASIDCSWSRPVSYPRWGHLKMEIVGEKGAVVMDAFAQHLTLYSRGAVRDPGWIGFGPDPNQAMMAEFVGSIRENRYSWPFHGTTVARQCVWHWLPTNRPLPESPSPSIIRISGWFPNS